MVKQIIETAIKNIQSSKLYNAKVFNKILTEKKGNDLAASLLKLENELLQAEGEAAINSLLKKYV